MEPTYENIKPLIKNETVEGNQVKVQFQAEGHDQPIDAVATVAPETKDVMKNAGKKAVKQSFWSSIIRVFSSAAGSAAGGGMAGSAARSATSSAGRAAVDNKTKKDDPTAVKITPERQQAACVDAFKTVQPQMFEWDGESNAWKAKQLA